MSLEINFRAQHIKQLHCVLYFACFHPRDSPTKLCNHMHQRLETKASQQNQITGLNTGHYCKTEPSSEFAALCAFRESSAHIVGENDDLLHNIFSIRKCWDKEAPPLPKTHVSQKLCRSFMLLHVERKRNGLQDQTQCNCGSFWRASLALNVSAKRGR